MRDEGYGRWNLLLKLPTVEADIAAGLVETEIEVVDAGGITDLCREGEVFLDRTRLGDIDCADDGAILAVEMEDEGAGALGGCRDGEMLGTAAEVDTPQADILTVVDVLTKCQTLCEVQALSLNQKNYHGDFLHEVPDQLTAYPAEIFGEAEWIIQPKAHFNILQKMQNGIALKDMPISINYGIKTGYNDAFFIDEDTRERLISEDPKSAELIKPLLRGRDIKAWFSGWDYLYLLFVPWHFPLHLESSIQGCSAEAEFEFEDQYPAIYHYLENYKDKLSARNRAETGIRYEWYALQRWAADYYEEFLKPKIMYPNMTSVFPFVYDEFGFLGNDKTFMITAKDDSVNLKFITAILNSKLCKLWIWYNCPELQGGTREIRKVYFENFRIPHCDDPSTLSALTDQQIQQVSQLQHKRSRFLRRLSSNFEGIKITTALQTFDSLSFTDFTKELKKQKIKLSLSQQDEWEDYFNDYRSACQQLSAQIVQTDAEIDTKVFDLYGLTEKERKVII